MKKLLKAIQGAGAAVAASILANPEAVSAFVPRDKQAMVAASISLVAAFLPPLIERAKKYNQGGFPPPQEPPADGGR